MCCKGSIKICTAYNERRSMSRHTHTHTQNRHLHFISHKRIAASVHNERFGAGNRCRKRLIFAPVKEIELTYRGLCVCVLRAQWGTCLSLLPLQHRAWSLHPYSRGVCVCAWKCVCVCEMWTVEAVGKVSIFMLITYRLLKVKRSLLHVVCSLSLSHTHGHTHTHTHFSFLCSSLGGSSGSLRAWRCG